MGRFLVDLEGEMEKTRIAIVGSGPAGYTSGLYAARASLNPTLFAGIKSGGQLMWTNDVENFPGFPDGVKGPQLMMQMRQQAEKFGTKIIDRFVTAVDFSSRPFKIWTKYPDGVNPDDVVQLKGMDQINSMISKVKEQEHDIEAETVIISTGAVAILPGIPGEQELLGKGLSTCAVCDAAFYKDKDTFVVGGGDAAMEDAMALTKFAKSVTIIHRRDQLRASKIMQDRVLNHEKVKMMWNTVVKEAKGSEKLTSIVVEENAQEKELPADGLFIAIGHKPMTQIFHDQVWLDETGYVVTRQSANWQGLDLAERSKNEKGLISYPTMTSVDGVFAAGDVVDIRYKQAVTSAGQGSQAALDAEWWLEIEE